MAHAAYQIKSIHAATTLTPFSNFPVFAPCGELLAPLNRIAPSKPSKGKAARIGLGMAPCQIRKIAGCACAGNARNVVPATAG